MTPGPPRAHARPTSRTGRTGPPVMPTVSLRFSALPAHVRTARLVAAALARRTGVDEGLLDEVRLAVGEACSRAVSLHQQHCPTEPVEVRLSDENGRFSVVVADAAPGDRGEAAEAALPAVDVMGGLGEAADPLADPLAPQVGLAVLAGLVDDLTVSREPTGSTVRMAWPA